jgi:isopentenyl-diphosphate Delta-isomerase
LTRRALQKRTWPGVWTNSFCGHPSPGERTVDAVYRRGRQELGLTIDEAVCVARLPIPRGRRRRRSRERDLPGLLCPLRRFCATGADEVMDYRWVPWREVRQAAGLPWVISPWAVEQIPLLDASIYMDYGPGSSGSSATQIH